MTIERSRYGGDGSTLQPALQARKSDPTPDLDNMSLCLGPQLVTLRITNFI